MQVVYEFVFHFIQLQQF